jgi:hypothetical protein
MAQPSTLNIVEAKGAEKAVPVVFDVLIVTFDVRLDDAPLACTAISSLRIIYGEDAVKIDGDTIVIFGQFNKDYTIGMVYSSVVSLFGGVLRSHSVPDLKILTMREVWPLVSSLQDTTDAT